MSSNSINNQTETHNHLVRNLINLNSLSALQTAALFDAVQVSRRIILSLGENINVRCKETGATLMHFAALNKKHGLDLIKYFSSLGLEVDAKDKFGEEPTDYALRVKNINIAEALLLKSKNNLLLFFVSRNKLEKAKTVLKCERDILFDLGENGNNAFHVAARDADLEMCKWLLGEGLDPRATSKDEFSVTALHLAGYNALHGPEIVEFLVSTLKMDVNARDRVQNTPLHYALLKENFGVAEQLASLGADLTFSLLLFCIQKNKLDGVKFLHAKNPDLFRKLGEDGRNALHFAANHSDLRMCRWLAKECGVDARAVAQKWKKSVLHYAAWNKLHGREIISNFAWSFGLDLNSEGVDGFTPICCAIQVDNSEAAEALASCGADLKLKIGKENLMQFCIRRNSLECAKVLFKKCPELMEKVNKKGLNMLHLAAQCADVKMCDWLIQDCRFNVHDVSAGRKNSVLHYAAKNLSHGEELIQFFASSFYLNMKARNLYGLTPLDYARRCKNDAAEVELTQIILDRNYNL